METPSPTTEKPPKLHWYQWRLRLLFILVLLAAIGMSWLTVEMQNERKQYQAAEEIRKVGGKVESERTCRSFLSSLAFFLRSFRCGSLSGSFPGTFRCCGSPTLFP